MLKQLHPIYLPFTEEELLKHFAKVKKTNSNSNHLNYYIKSIEKSLTRFKITDTVIKNLTNEISDDKLKKLQPLINKTFFMEELNDKFKKINNNLKENNLNYFTEKEIEIIKKYSKYSSNNLLTRKGKPISNTKQTCQIEKDEKFWTAACLMTIYYSQNRTKELIDLLTKAYGHVPPIDIKDIKSWDDCIGEREDLYLFFEVSLPSTPAYNDWLSKNLKARQFIPYILDSADGKVEMEGATLLNKKKKMDSMDSADGKVEMEGATKVDAMILNSKTGFAVIIEAKVLSDLSCDVTYDTMRNQLARNIDVMLEKNNELCQPLNQRDPDRTLFLLLTPEMYKNNPGSRFYGYKFHDYKKNPASIANDLPHRGIAKLKDLSRKIGWLTWEDFKSVNKNCCQWL